MCIMALKRRPPANNVRRAKSNGRNTWGVATNQAGETVQFESDYAKRLLYQLLRTPGVYRVISEPMIIPFVDDIGKMHTYIPDYKVIYLDGTVEIHEFSMAAARLRSNIRARELGARNYLQGLGWDYIVHTEIDLPTPTEYANLRAVRRFAATSYYDHRISSYLSSLLCSGVKIHICDLAAKVSTGLQVPLPEVFSVIWHMAWHNTLTTHPDTLLILDGAPNPRAVIWLTKRKEESQ
jgi:hypothetical protein